jgi:hypothetical protein
MKQHFINPGETARMTIAHSEVAMHMGVAGKVMNVRLEPTERYAVAQLLTDDGREFSAPITVGEAGFYSERSGDGRTLFYYYEEAPVA